MIPFFSIPKVSRNIEKARELRLRKLRSSAMGLRTPVQPKQIVELDYEFDLDSLFLKGGEFNPYVDTKYVGTFHADNDFWNWAEERTNFFRDSVMSPYGKIAGIFIQARKQTYPYKYIQVEYMFLRSLNLSLLVEGMTGSHWSLAPVSESSEGYTARAEVGNRKWFLTGKRGERDFLITIDKKWQAQYPLEAVRVMRQNSGYATNPLLDLQVQYRESTAPGFQFEQEFGPWESRRIGAGGSWTLSGTGSGLWIGDRV